VIFGVEVAQTVPYLQLKNHTDPTLYRVVTAPETLKTTKQ